MGKKPNKPRSKNLSDIMKGQVWSLPQLGKLIVLDEVDLWSETEHNDKQAFELLDQMKQGQKPDTVVCFNLYGYKYLHAYALGFEPGKPDKNAKQAFGFKIESASIISWYMEGGKRKARVHRHYNNKEKTLLCVDLGFTLTGWKNSPTEIRYLCTI
jgi:hypothetical protein